MSCDLHYLSGFGNEFASEAIAGALPVGRNSPQRVAHGLYAELLSGTAFTAPRAENRRTWTYRRRPSVCTSHFSPLEPEHVWLKTGSKGSVCPPPNPLRWHPMPVPADGEPALDFIGGLRTIATCGTPAEQSGLAVHLALMNRSMTRAFVNFDGELLIVPQQGRLHITTELGILQVGPGEIALLPRGLAIRIRLLDGASRAYVCENYGAPFRLPELGPIGSNGLANARDFLAPVAAFEADPSGGMEVVRKVGGRLWAAQSAATPFNVVAWHGNLVPLKYDTRRFMAIGSISFDHPDPSIFTVLTSPSETPGTANADFVIFPPRWMVADDTFRPPWYHRNTMSEFMGLVHGEYDAKPEGFKPGGMSLHNAWVPHGPDADAFEAASSAALAPRKLDNTLAFMFETRWLYQLTDYATQSPSLDTDYLKCWGSLGDRFSEPN